jgi:hypothetical protein
VVGYDLDDTSVAAARRHAASRGVTGRVSFEVRDVTDPELASGYDGGQRRESRRRPMSDIGSSLGRAGITVTASRYVRRQRRVEHEEAR